MYVNMRDVTRLSLMPQTVQSTRTEHTPMRYTPKTNKNMTHKSDRCSQIYFTLSIHTCFSSLETLCVQDPWMYKALHRPKLLAQTCKNSSWTRGSHHQETPWRHWTSTTRFCSDVYRSKFRIDGRKRGKDQRGLQTSGS